MNVVFDLGGVVFHWRPDDIARRVFDDPDIQDLLKTLIFAHDYWLELDRGTMSLEQAVDRGAERTGLSRSEIRRLVDEVPRSLTPVPGTADLIRSVKNSNNKLFILSNMQFESIAYLEEEHDIWNYQLDSIIYIYEEGKEKLGKICKRIKNRIDMSNISNNNTRVEDVSEELVEEDDNNFGEHSDTYTKEADEGKIRRGKLGKSG